MDFFKWLIGGLIGAAIGAAVWIAVVHFANYEVGYIALLVGFLAGIGVRTVAGDEVGIGPGIAAVGAAAFAMLIAKYVLVSIVIAQAFGGDEFDFSVPGGADQGIAYMADDVVAEAVAREEEVVWPEDDSVYEDDIVSNDYSEEIWTAAQERWEALDEAAQAEFIEKKQEEEKLFLAEFQDELKQEIFKQSFTPYDLLWFGLAGLTAYSTGNGLNNDEEKVAAAEPDDSDAEGDGPEPEPEQQS
ncbi:hypothetical protein KOR42_29980 [Thalassoglobus neptunius]|uniref:Uncharacterized protein n=1 Tax=Thalassoglobus neptunius TaxID=1938619 RepID=A0A5C5WR70_9PLAN|nr:hypothetical protein [Thalassoglobus neptunius]TWT52312.1 hypothetical protein KOR42_29980 [Thalassoglobus neptunius]